MEVEKLQLFYILYFTLNYVKYKCPIFYLGHGPFSHLFEDVKKKIHGNEVICLLNITYYFSMTKLGGLKINVYCSLVSSSSLYCILSTIYAYCILSTNSLF